MRIKALEAVLLFMTPLKYFDCLSLNLNYQQITAQDLYNKRKFN